MFMIGDRIRITHTRHHHGCPKEGDIGFLINIDWFVLNKFAIAYAIFAKSKPEFKPFVIDLGMHKSDKYKLLKNEHQHKCVISNVIMRSAYSVVHVIPSRIVNYEFEKYKVRFANFVLEEANLELIDDAEFKAYKYSINHLRETFKSVLMTMKNAYPMNDNIKHNIASHFKAINKEYSKHTNDKTREFILKFSIDFKKYYAQYIRNILYKRYIQNANRDYADYGEYIRERLNIKYPYLILDQKVITPESEVIYRYIRKLRNLMFLASPLANVSNINADIVKIVSGITIDNIMELKAARRFGGAALTRIYDMTKDIQIIY